MSDGLLVACLLASGGLLLGLAVLVTASRVVRAAADRASAARTARYVAALESAGPVELTARTRAACRRGRAQDDLATALARALPQLDERRRELVDHALAAARVEAAVVRGLAAAGARRRARAVLLATHMHRIELERLEPLLGDPDPDIRLAAVRAVAERRSYEAARTLVRCLVWTPVPAERVVERLAGAWSVPHVTRALACVSEPRVRAWLAESLGLSGDRAGAPALVGLLATGTREERVRACRALGRLGLRSSVPAILRALADDEEAVRAQAARALESIPDPRALATLGERLADRSWWVRANSARALAALGEPGRAMLRLAASAHRDRFARQRASEALALDTMRRRRGREAA